MFVFAFEKVLFKFKYNAPQFKPFSRLPPKSNSGRVLNPLIFFIYGGGKFPRSPSTSYACKGCSQESDAAMCVSAAEKVSYKDKYNAPQWKPSSR